MSEKIKEIKKNNSEKEENNNLNEETKFLKNDSPQPQSSTENDGLNELCAKMLFFSNGLSTFSNLAITFYLKDTLKLSPSQSALYQSILAFPSILQPFFGFISDTYILFGYKRKSYIIITSSIIFISWIYLSLFNPSAMLTLSILLIKEISKSFLGACSNAVSAEISKKREKNDKKLENFNTVFIYINIGNIISSVTRGVALEYLNTNKMFFISGILSLISVIAGILYKEIKAKNEIYKEKIANKKNNYKELFGIIKQRQFIILLTYMLILSTTPSYYESSFYYLSDAKNFSKIDFGNFSMALMIIFSINSFINKRIVNSFKPKTVIIFTTIMAFLFGSIYNLWIIYDLNSKIIVFTGISLYIGFKALSAKPIFNLAFLACPKGYEGSITGLFYSLRDLGDILASLFGSYMAYIFDIQGKNYTTYNKMIFIINLISLLPIFFISLINDKTIISIHENKDEK